MWAWPVLADTTKEIEQPVNFPYVQETHIPFIQETYDPCSCVSFAKWYLGIPQKETWGNAKEIIPTSKTPQPLGLFITSEGLGHVGVVLRVSSASFDVVEANFKPCSVSYRTLPLNYPYLKGFR